MGRRYAGIYIVRYTPKDKSKPIEEYHYDSEDEALYVYNCMLTFENMEPYEMIEMIYTGADTEKGQNQTQNS